LYFRASELVKRDSIQIKEGDKCFMDLRYDGIQPENDLIKSEFSTWNKMKNYI
jgi:hypothetical protein